MVGARAVARAWTDPAYKRKLLENTTEALIVDVELTLRRLRDRARA